MADDQKTPDAQADEERDEGTTPPAGRGFEPGRYLTRVGGADYLEVKWRLVWLRDVHPDAVVYTELVSHQGQDAIFRATVSIPDGGSATGYGSEAYDDFRDYIEKAETKALGRALAALGFGTQFCPDFEFGARDGRVVDSPVHRGPGQRTPNLTNPPRVREPGELHTGEKPAEGTGSAGTITPKQVKFLRAIARELRLSDEALIAEAERLYGCVPEQLARRDASQFIERLQARRGAHPDSLAS